MNEGEAPIAPDVPPPPRRVPGRVPTLTEVVARPSRTALPGAPAPAGAPPGSAPPREATPRTAPVSPSEPVPPLETAAPPRPTPLPEPAPPPDVAPPLRLAEGQIIEGVLLQLQRQVDLMLEYRLREVLTPLLARAADGVVRDARGQLASTLRDVVARAVAEELAKHRGRAG